MAKRSHVKRKAGHIGFQKNEIAFIEDEMAALAAEYGLSIDQDVAVNVNKRQQAKKKARMRRHESSTKPTSSIGNADRIRLAPGPIQKTIKLRDFSSIHLLIVHALRSLLPVGIKVERCTVPGCNCMHGHRDLIVQEQDEESHDTMQEYQVIQQAQCKKCQHSICQHGLVQDEYEFVKPSGGKQLLSSLYELIRVGRLAGSVFRSRVWVTSILTLLENMMMHVKKQFVAGGTQNGQKNALELQQEQSLLTEMQNLVQQAEKTSQKAISRDEMVIALACVFDQMYFHSYYTSIVLYGRACTAIPAPEEYFKDLMAYTPHALPLTETFIHQELVADNIPSSLVESLVLPMLSTSKTKDKDDIALLEIYHMRFFEGIRMFYEQSIGMNGEIDALLMNAGGKLVASGSTKPSKPSNRRYQRRDEDSSSNDTSLVEMPAYELLQEWRNNCRDWCCHLYAYATPTTEALCVMSKYGPMVEMGAGTGYWASLLQARGVNIQAFDAIPPSQQISPSAYEKEDAFAPKKKMHGQKSSKNAYHGYVPTFCNVTQGKPEDLAHIEVPTLFLCYPPPGDEMARQCLRYFKGEYVIYVGEWQGDTATPSFEKALECQFIVVNEIELPNWGNSAYSLTVWQRRSCVNNGRGRGELGPSVLNRLSCFHCKTSLMGTEEEAPLKRCVLCKTNAYCSSECALADHRAHAAEHAKRLLFLNNEEKLEFESDRHYKPLHSIEIGEEEEEHDSIVQLREFETQSTVSNSLKTSSGEDKAFAFNFIQ